MFGSCDNIIMATQSVSAKQCHVMHGLGMLQCREEARTSSDSVTKRIGVLVLFLASSRVPVTDCETTTIRPAQQGMQM